MRRREFMATFGAMAAWPLAARAQQPVIGFLNDGSSDAFARRLEAFREGLSELGYVEGQNIAIEFRWAEGRYDRLPEMAVDLAQRQVAAIAASASPSAVAAKGATSTIPIIFAIGGDPVKFGLVKSLARPDGNATGINFFTVAVGQKRLGLLHELVAKGAVIGFLANPSNPNTTRSTEEAQAAAEQLGGGLVVDADAFFVARRVQITTLAARHGIPAIHPSSEFVAVGGLMGYASSLPDAYRSMGNYTARVLKGTKLADLPVLQSTKLELAINLSTARALGLTIPPGVLAIADEVVE
jgi:putative tryptophan/tyrosine transport system substrate-binding protein